MIQFHRNVSNSQVYSNDEFDLWPVYSGERFRAFRPSCLFIFMARDVDGVHEILCNLNILLLKLKSALFPLMIQEI